jgi:hypothetical protein
MTDIEEIRRRAKELLAAGERPKIIAWPRAQLVAAIPAQRHRPPRGSNDGPRAEITELTIAPGLPERMEALIEPVISDKIVLAALMLPGASGLW